MEWPIEIDFEDGSARASTVRTTYGPYEHPALGRCLRISTTLQIDAEDPGSWCFERNEQLTSGPVDTFVLGGWSAWDGNPVTYTTIVPAALDRSTSIDRHASFIGTNLNHHVSEVARLLMHDDGVEAPDLTVALLAERYGQLAEFYREAGLDIPIGLTTVLTGADDNREIALSVFLPRSLPGGLSEWPRLGTFDQESEPFGVRTLVPLSTMPTGFAARFAHAAILGAAKARADGGAISLPLSTVSSPLSANDIDAALGALIDEEVLCFDEDRGELLVAPMTSRIVLTVELDGEHPVWGSALTITATCPRPSEQTVATRAESAVIANSLQIGDWHREDDHPKYRVCLPPQAFITTYRETRQQLFMHAVRSVAAHAKRPPGPTA